MASILKALVFACVDEKYLQCSAQKEQRKPENKA